MMNLRNIYEIARKEALIFAKSRRLVIISIIYAIVFFVLIYYGQYLSGGGTEALYKHGVNYALNSIIGFTSLFPTILAIALSYDAIAGEKSNRSFHLMITRPVKREEIYLGKFIAITGTIVFIFFIVFIPGYLWLAYLGGMPSMDETLRALGAVALILLGASGWVAISMFISTMSKTTGTALIVAIISWILIIPIVSQIGLIAYYVSAAGTEKEYEPNIYISVQPNGQNSTVIFTAMALTSSYDGNVLYRVEDSNGTVYRPWLVLSQSSSVFSLGPGNYSWYAYPVVMDSSGRMYYDKSTAISYGHLKIIHGLAFSYSIAPEPWRNTQRFDRFTITLYPPGNYSVIMRDSDGKEYTTKPRVINGVETYNISGVPEGKYNLIIENEDGIIFEGFVVSYGTNPLGISLDRDSMPDYVKYNMMINPSTDSEAYSDILLDQDNALIPWWQGALALVVMVSAYTIAGIYIMRRIELF